MSTSQARTYLMVLGISRTCQKIQDNSEKRTAAAEAINKILDETLMKE